MVFDLRLVEWVLASRGGRKRQKEQYDRRVHRKPYKVGNQVWLHSSVVPRGSFKKLHCP